MLARLHAKLIRRGVLFVLLLAFGCENSTPTAPSTVTVSSGGSTLKVSAPIPQSPIANAEVDVLNPKLTSGNAQSLFVSGVNFFHEFQLFHVATKSTLMLVESGTVLQEVTVTSYVVENPLEDDQLYQWKVRAFLDGSYGPWSEMAAFSTNIPVSIGPPIPLQPAPDEVVDSVRPVLEIENPVIEGETGTVMIEFQVALDPNFQNMVSIMSEELGRHAGIHTPLTGPRQSALSRAEKTSAQVTADLQFDTTYYWRTRGTNGIVSRYPSVAAPGSIVGNFSQVISFKVASEAVVNAGGGGSGGTVSSGTEDDELDLSEVVWLHHNFSDWPQTSTITSTTIGAPPICIDHTKVGQWPSGDFSGSGAIVDSNPWVFANIGGTWYAATWEWVRVGTTCKSLGASDFKTHVNGASPLNTWTPQSGEQIGLMISTPARFGPEGSVNERSNVVLRTWP